MVLHADITSWALVSVTLGLLCVVTCQEICHQQCTCQQNADAAHSHFVVNCTKSSISDASAVLHDKLLQNLPLATTIDLSINGLQVLDGDAVSVPTVEILLLQYNNIIYIEDHYFSKLQLKLLDLSFNNIGTFPVVVCRSLLHLNLSYNSINVFKSGALSGLTNLMVLSLHNNQLITLNQDVFRGANKLHHLDLSNNNLEYIEDNMFATLSSLSYLNLKHNKLEAVPSGLPLMNYLDVSHNLIQAISDTHKESIYPLEVLVLSHNPLVCDCNLLWLKEWWDRSEYKVDLVALSHDEYVPKCSEPVSVNGDAWDVLDDAIFVCDNNESNGSKNSELENEGSSNRSADSKFDLNITLISVNNSVAHLHWNPSSTADSVAIKVEYYEFGRKDSVFYIQVSKTENSVAINALKHSTPYVICVHPTYAKDAPYFNNCIEVVTATRYSMHVLWYCVATGIESLVLLPQHNCLALYGLLIAVVSTAVFVLVQKLFPRKVKKS